jgi:hypothetical protein
VAAATSTRNVSLGVHRLGLEAELSDPERSGRMESAGLSKDHCWRWGESMGAVGAAMVWVGCGVVWWRWIVLCVCVWTKGTGTQRMGKGQQVLAVVCEGQQVLG